MFQREEAHCAYEPLSVLLWWEGGSCCMLARQVSTLGVRADDANMFDLPVITVYHIPGIFAMVLNQLNQIA